MALGLIALIVWPQAGPAAGWGRMRAWQHRAFIEDALKHLHTCEWRGGAAIRLLGNIVGGGQSPAWWAAHSLNPLGLLIGLGGVILPASIIAIPANEIVAPAMMMAYMGVGRMTDAPDYGALRTLLIDGRGGTMLTAVNLMLFSLLHNPCATTILTLRKETRSLKWTTLGALGPPAPACLVCRLTVSLAPALGWV